MLRSTRTSCCKRASDYAHHRLSGSQDRYFYLLWVSPACQPLLPAMGQTTSSPYRTPQRRAKSVANLSWKPAQNPLLLPGFVQLRRLDRDIFHFRCLIMQTESLRNGADDLARSRRNRHRTTEGLLRAMAQAGVDARQRHDRAMLLDGIAPESEIIRSMLPKLQEPPSPKTKQAAENERRRLADSLEHQFNTLKATLIARERLAHRLRREHPSLRSQVPSLPKGPKSQFLQLGYTVPTAKGGVYRCTSLPSERALVQGQRRQLNAEDAHHEAAHYHEERKMMWQDAKGKLDAFKVHIPRIDGICSNEEFELSSKVIELRSFVREWEGTRESRLATYLSASEEVAQCEEAVKRDMAKRALDLRMRRWTMATTASLRGGHRA